MFRQRLIILAFALAFQVISQAAYADTGCDGSGRLTQDDQGSGFVCQYGQNSYGPTNADATPAYLQSKFGYSSLSSLSSNDLNNFLAGYSPLSFQSATYSGACPAGGGNYCPSTTPHADPIIDPNTGLYENTAGYYPNPDDPTGSVGGQFYTPSQLAAAGLPASYDPALNAAPVSDGGYGGNPPASTSAGSSGSSGGSGSGSSGSTSTTSAAPDVSALTDGTDFSTTGTAILAVGALGVGMLLAWVAVKYVRRVTGAA